MKTGESGLGSCSIIAHRFSSPDQRTSRVRACDCLKKCAGGSAVDAPELWANTFFNGNGLNILEAAEGSQEGAQSAKVVTLPTGVASLRVPWNLTSPNDRRCHHAWISTLT